MGSVRVWGRLTALLVLCAMLSAVLAVAGPSADAQVTEHPENSCLGLNACTDLTPGHVVLDHVSATSPVIKRPAQ